MAMARAGTGTTKADSLEGKAERREVEGLFFVVSSSAGLLGYDSEADKSGALHPPRTHSDEPGSDTDADVGGGGNNGR
jgi:hypothetical protein